MRKEKKQVKGQSDLRTKRTEYIITIILRFKKTILKVKNVTVKDVLKTKSYILYFNNFSIQRYFVLNRR